MEFSGVCRPSRVKTGWEDFIFVSTHSPRTRTPFTNTNEWRRRRTFYSVLLTTACSHTPWHWTFVVPRLYLCWVSYFSTVIFLYNKGFDIFDAPSQSSRACLPRIFRENYEIREDDDDLNTGSVKFQNRRHKKIKGEKMFWQCRPCFNELKLWTQSYETNERNRRGN